MKLKGKVAIITGASRGIGKATALLFAKEGASITVNYRSSEQEARSLVEEIEQLGAKATAIKCDVAKEHDVKRLVEKTIAAFGSIDILVNNAGIVFDLPCMDHTVEHWRKTLDVNLIGTFLCSKHAAPHLRKQDRPVIINVSSTNAIDSHCPESIDYDASKAGVIALTKNLAQELAPHVRVNAVAPGWVDTGMNKDLPTKFIKAETDKIALKRFAKPEEIAQAILFLASADASFITGSVLKIDGGYQ